MRILLVLHHHLTQPGGASGATLELAGQYTRLGHQTDLFSFDDLPAGLSESVALALFPLFVLRRLARSAPYDVVDAAAGDNWLSSLRRPGSTRGPLLVARSHGLEHTGHRMTLEQHRLAETPLSWKYGLYRGGLHLREVASSLRRADLALLLNRPDLELAVHTLGVPPDRARLTRNGIRPDFLGLPFEPTPTEPGSPVQIALVGSYIWRKGVDYAATALAAVLGRHPNVRVGFFGTGCDARRVLADYEPALARRIDVVQQFELRQLPRLVSGYHILLFPTLGEGFSLALVEAMACGLAPVTTDAPGPAEIVRDGIDGLIVGARDGAALANAIEMLLRERSRLDALRRAAWSRAQEYSWTAVAEETVGLYEEYERRRMHPEATARG